MTAMAKPLSDADILNIAAYFSLQVRMSTGLTAAQVIATYERIRPVANVQVAAIAAESAPVEKGGAKSALARRSGEVVYTASCAACHASGAAGAPKLGDKTAWSARLAQGRETLHKHAIQGFKAMPPKGACVACSDDEIKAAADFILSKAK